MRDGLIREVPGMDAGRGRGRPKVMIELDPDRRLLIAVKLSINRIEVTLGDFAGGIGKVDGPRAQHAGTVGRRPHRRTSKT